MKIQATRISIPRILSMAAILLGIAAGMGEKRASGQAVPTATGPGSYLAVGLTASGFQQDYGHHYIGGEALFVDANVYRKIGIEAEGRLLNAHTEESVKESTYLIGPRISVLPRHGFRPYVKFLVGRGTLDYPFHYAVGHYFAMAPGGGVDYHLLGRLNVRIVDFEYQIWPQFSYGELHPYGLSAGLSFDVLLQSSRIRGRHF